MGKLERKVDLLVKWVLSDTVEERQEVVEALAQVLNDSVDGRTWSERAKMVAEDILTLLGMPCNLNGYSYLVTAICIMAERPDFRYSITKELYPTVAAIYGDGATPFSVERSMRHAIEVLWDRCSPELLEKYFGLTVSSKRDKLTNSEFICQVAMYVQRALQDT